MATPDLVITVVHGTFPRGMTAQVRRDLRATWARLQGGGLDETRLWGMPSEGQAAYWFEKNSAFEADLLAPLIAGRRVIECRRFLWSGRNSLTDRAAAATALRAQLHETHGEFPGVPHAVIAHSHGGTVAVDALDGSQDAAPVVALLVTLGTPFVQLATRPERWAAARDGWQGLAAGILPGAILSWGVLGALAYLLRREGWHDAVAVFFLLVALRAVIRWGFGASALVVLGTAVFGGAAVRSDLVVAALVSAVAGLLLLAVPSPPQQRVRSLLRDTPRRLRCAVLALRSPGDEATLAIVGAQAVEKLTLTVVRIVGALASPFFAAWSWASGDMSARGLLGRGLARIRGLGAALIAGLVVGGLVLGLRWLNGAPPAPFLERPTGPLAVQVAVVLFQAALISLMGLLSVIALALALLYVVAMGLITSSWAVGPESFWLPLIPRVDAEPLPEVDDESRPRMRLEILYGASVRGLAHSLYESPEVRARVQEALRLLLPPGRA